MGLASNGARWIGALRGVREEAKKEDESDEDFEI